MVQNEQRFLNNRARGRIAETDVNNLLSTHGYEVKNFGIESHSIELKKILKKKYDLTTNQQILSMPDFIAVDETKNLSWFVEIKKTGLSIIDRPLMLTPYIINRYRRFWPGTIIVFTSGSWPFFKCVNVDKIKDKHLIKIAKDKNGEWREHWDFRDIFENIWNIFDRIKKEDLMPKE